MRKLPHRVKGNEENKAYLVAEGEMIQKGRTDTEEGVSGAWRKLIESRHSH